MAFWEVAGFINVVLPIMSMKNAKLIGISSPAYSEFNFFTRLQNIKIPNSNMHVCMTIKAELCCPACKKNGTGAYCTHYNSMLPPWISSEAKFINSLIYKALKMEKAGERELSGMNDTQSGMAIRMELIQRFSRNPVFVGGQHNKPKYIGVFVDPNGGGSSSMAIISVTMVLNALVVRNFIFFLLLFNYVYLINGWTFMTILKANRLHVVKTWSMEDFEYNSLLLLIFKPNISSNAIDIRLSYLKRRTVASRAS